MNIAEQIRLKLKLKENSEVEYKSAAGGFPRAEFWRTFSALANTNGGTIMLGVKEKSGHFIPDGLSEELISKYRKQFWDDAHNKSCVSIPLLVESDIEEIKTDGGQYLLAFRIPRAQYDLRPVHLTLTPFRHTYKRRNVIAKGWRDNGWSIPKIAEKNNPNRIETCLKFAGSTTETKAPTTENLRITTETTTDTTTKTHTSTTETIVRMIMNNPKITIKEIAKACGITEDGVAYHIKKLKAAGRIIRIGGSRNGGEWKIIN